MVIVELYLLVSECNWKSEQVVVRRLWQTFMWMDSYMDPIILLSPFILDHFPIYSSAPLLFPPHSFIIMTCMLHHLTHTLLCINLLIS